MKMSCWDDASNLLKYSISQTMLKPVVKQYQQRALVNL
jgi:hypothetical protein